MGRASWESNEALELMTMVKNRDSIYLVFLDAFCRVPPLYSFAQITTAKWMRSTSRQRGMAMKFGFVPTEWEGMSGKRTMVGQYCYQGYQGNGQQHRYTTLTIIPPRVKKGFNSVLFSTVVHTEWLWKIVLLTLAASRGVTDLYPCLYPSWG